MSDPPAKKQRKLKPHKLKHKSCQNKVKAEMKQQVFDMFSRNQFDAEDAVDFLHGVEKELDHVPNEIADFREVVQDQYQSLSQTKKRSLVSNLTHKDGELNVEMLECLPFLRNRSVKLLANPDRKEREDKIDLSFISDFMHEYCRYVNY